MKRKSLKLASCLAFSALLVSSQAKSPVAPPSTGTTSTSEPCGNPEPSGTPYCKKCVEGVFHYVPQVGSSCDTNSIRSYNGNAHRRITDLEIAGSVGKMPLTFERFSSTRLSSRNLAHSAFGSESSWSHNFEWVVRDNGGTVERPIIKITYPQGDEMRFQRWSATSSSWLPTNHRNPDRIISTGADFVLTTGDLKKYGFKRRIHSVSGGVFYRLESITDSEANTQVVTYLNNDDTLIRQVTDPAGHWIKLHYNDLSVRSNASTVLNEQLLPSGSTGVWKEVTLTPGASYRMLALYQGNTYRQAIPLRVSELEFYDENNVKITGTAFGSWPWATNREPFKAFDGNLSTDYQYAYEKAGYVGLDLGAGNAKKVSRIRFRLASTVALNSDASVTFVGMNNDLVPNYVVSHVQGSDGREVGYDYSVYTEPSAIFQWVQLTAANYSDLTEFTYTYKWQHRHVMPVLETAKDPRYSGAVKQVRYGYDLNTVVGFVSDEYDHGSGQLVASVRWDGAHIPKLVYPNGKANRFEYTDGNVMRAIDSYGGATDYTYTWNGFVLTEDDPLGRTTTYTRRSDGQILSKATPGGSVTTYTRNTAGYVTAVNENGKVTSYILDTSNRITRTNHPDGSYETWTFNSFGQKLSHRLRNASNESWTYSANGLLTQHIDPAGIVTDYSYNTLNRLASETRHLNSSTAYTTSYTYDDRGSLIRMTHPDGSFVEHAYDPYGNRIATLDERGQLTQWTYDSLSRMLTETDPNDNTTTYNYTSSLGGGCGCNTGGLPVTITYPDGTITLNTYDKEWRLTSTTLALGTPQASTTSYAYDLAGQRTSMTDPLGRVTTYTYDADGRLISETQASGTPVALTSTRTYSVDGDLISTTQGAGSPAAVTTTMTYDVMDRVVSTTAAAGTPVAIATSSAYNALGQLVSTTDPLGLVTTYSYDAAGRRTDSVLPDGTVMKSVYDAFSRTIQSISAFGQPEQAVTTITYDSRDRAITQTDPTGVTSTSFYDAGGLVTAVTMTSGKSVAFVYDAGGRLLQMVTAPGTAEQTISSTSYDSRNRPVTQTDGAGSVTTVTYDRLGRTLTVKDALNHTTTFTYDLVGNQLTTKAADNLVTSTRTYDALDRLTSEKDGKNQTISYQYDALGRKTAYTDAKGATFSFQFDLLGRLTRRTEPDATYQTYTYDAAGRLLVHRKADNATKTHVYGNANRDFLTQITYSNGEAPRVMSYDRLGRLLSAVNAHSTITRSYDAAGRTTAETQALTSGPTGTFSYLYDADGNLSRHTRPDGSYVDYAWNARNLLASVTSDAPPPLATYTYNGRNQTASHVVESGLFTATRTYDTAGRLTGVSNGALDSTSYALSADGRRTGITRNGTAETYGYDNARQVTSASLPLTSGTTANSYAYDAAGNRSTATTNGATTSYTANSVNAYTAISGGGFSPPNPTYDANGNLLTGTVLPLGSSSLTSCVFTWNIHNELISASNGNGDSASYQYDALGRRTQRTETLGTVTTTTWFLTNGWNVELEYQGGMGGSPVLSNRLSWGLDLSGGLQGAGGVGGLVMVETLPSGGGSPVPSFPTYDGNGNITAWVNASGSVIARQRYDAYGNLIEQTGTPPSNYGFSTKPQEKVTGFHYYGYRYYDALTGRWPNRDPIEEMGGVNFYGFVGNDGMNQWDLWGLSDPNTYPCFCDSDLGRFKNLSFTLASETMIQRYEIKDPADTIKSFIKGKLIGLAQKRIDELAGDSVWVDIKNKIGTISSTVDTYSKILSVTHEIGTGMTITSIVMDVSFELCTKDKEGKYAYASETAYGQWTDITGLSIADEYQRKQLPGAYKDAMLEAAKDMVTKINKTRE